mmetsp:Transcript_5708/g.10418  ORF Transcript_5708/g.10418 Transcript_5708/m.10418 type:complete len:81 (+) Transcript_5708:32-274(+)
MLHESHFFACPQTPTDYLKNVTINIACNALAWQLVISSLFTPFHAPKMPSVSSSGSNGVARRMATFHIKLHNRITPDTMQ